MQFGGRIVRDCSQVNDTLTSVQQLLTKSGICAHRANVLPHKLDGRAKRAKILAPKVAHVQDTHTVASDQEFGNKTRAEIACTAGDEHVHPSLLSAAASAC